MSEPWLPLAGIRVVDFSMFVLGPFATAIFADLGADVIKVEPPRGDPGRSYVPVQFAHAATFGACSRAPSTGAPTSSTTDTPIVPFTSRVYALSMGATAPARAEPDQL